jgi:hypothetical protein
MDRPIARTLFILVVLHLVAVPAVANGQWTPIGPAPINGPFAGGVSGRASVIAVNPQDFQQVWLGTAAGGVWYSPNGGKGWQPLSDHVESLAVGALAVADCDSSGCATIYVGTGENAIRRDTYYGAGLLVGTRVGLDPLTYSWVPRDGSSSGYDFHGGSIVDIVLLPGTSGATTTLWIALSSGSTVSTTEATVTAPEPVGGYGIYKSNNQGATWDKLTVAGSNGALPTSLKMDPQETGVLYAGFLGRGVFKTGNGGATWCPLNFDGGINCPGETGLPDPAQETFDHVEIATTINTYAPGSPTYLYATFGLCADWKYQNCEPAIYKSLDAGNTWSQQRPGNPNNKTGSAALICGVAYSRYTHALGVHPEDHSTLYFGGLRLCRSGTSGHIWDGEVDDNATPGSSPWNTANRIHYDHHDIVFDVNNPTHRYSTSDGGFAEQISYGKWFPRNDGLQITGFQSISTSPLTLKILGASQDNGGQLWTGGLVWEYLDCCGDGGDTAMDLDNLSILYAGNNDGSLMRSKDAGTSWDDKQPQGEWYKAFYAPFVQDPSPPHPLYYGSNRLWRSDNDALSWTDVSPVLSISEHPEIWREGDVITAIAISPGDPNRIYVGYYSGEVWTTDAPSALCNDPEPPTPPLEECEEPADWDLVSQSLPDVPVTGIAVSPLDPQRAWVSFSGFGIFPRVWETSTAGQGWAAADTGLPAGVPANTLTIGRAPADTLLVGLDSNVTGSTLWRRPGGTSTWLPDSSGLPNAPVIDIVVDSPRLRTVVATHGRGAFVRGSTMVIPGECWWEEMHPLDLPFWGWEFTPGADCSIQVLQDDGTACVDSAVDALGGALRTDADGRVVSSLDGIFEDLPLVWACIGGECAGGVPIDSCESVDAVQVTCGRETATEPLQGVQMVSAPASALLRTAEPGIDTSDGASAAAQFDLVAELHSGDGSTRSLCTVHVPVAVGDAPSEIVTRAAQLLGESATCAAASLTAGLVGGEPGDGEDEWGPGPWLELRAPAETGTQLLPAVHVAPGEATGRCFELRSLGLPLRGQLHRMSLQFETAPSGAEGGEVTIVENSGLGTCAIALPTVPGQASDDVAGAVASAFQTPGIPGPHPHCPSRRNPRDVTAVDSTVRTVFASTLEVCLDDPGIGFFLKSGDLGNSHPFAGCADAVSECTGPDGADVQLDGTDSRDPDSSPGTNDDIVEYRWYRDYGTATEEFLGYGAQLDVPLPLGAHDVTLIVRDAAGLEDARECTASVVDTTPPSLSATPAPLELWPPNHRMVDVLADVSASDLCGGVTVELVSLNSDEPDDAPGDGDGETTGDVAGADAGADDRAYSLRAERDRNSSGRSYTAHYRGLDASANETLTDAIAVVPLHREGVTEPILLDVTSTGAGTLLTWTAAPGATSYQVISGELTGVVDLGNEYFLGPVICIEASSSDTTTLGDEDLRVPPSGGAFIYLVEYEDVTGARSGFGTESAAKPRVAGPGGCP